jgi:glycosyltransferase involved in cell wall biosynthesis
MLAMNFFYIVWLFAVVFSLMYLFVMMGFLSGWNGLVNYTQKQKQHHTRVSILLPFYNEFENLEACVEGLVHQQIQTTLVEILLIDDHSTDGSTKLAQQLATQYYQVSYLANPEGTKGKKAALETGIASAKGDLIITTDADCSHPPHWLSTMIDYYETQQAGLIIGPVTMQIGTSWLQKFQGIEFVSLIGTTGGAAGINRPIMCNGANLAFTKAVYQEFSDPFKKEFLSGDDVFLMHQVKSRYPESIHFIKSAQALVETKSAGSWKQFFRQRFRWASKTPGYTDSDTLFTAGVVFGISLTIILSALLMIQDLNFYKPLLFVFLFKTAIDSWFFFWVAPFFNKRKLAVYIPLFELFYSLYVVIASVSIIFKSDYRSGSKLPEVV